MKTDTEIKQWIDGKEVLTKMELSRHIYGKLVRKSTRLNRMWLYVLNTKDLKKLREYKDFKINKFSISPNFEKFKKLYYKDGRLRRGKRTAFKILKNVYNLEIPLTTLHRYKKLL